MERESKKNVLRVMIQSPFPEYPSRFLSVNPNLSLLHLSLSLPFPSRSFFFSLNGKPLLPCSSAPLHSLLPQSSSSNLLLCLHPRSSGGGGDGGATGAESRDCYLNMYAEKKPDKVDPNETRLSKWLSCSLSSHPLQPPCVLDRLGNLFNKEPLVEALLSKSLPTHLSSHIKSLRDTIPIHLSPIPGIGDDDDFITFKTRFQCPVTGLEFNGKYRFCALRPCGHVLSAKALKEVKSSACLLCHRNFSHPTDLIPINGSPDEVDALRQRMEDDIRSRSKSKDKKNAKARACSSAAAASAAPAKRFKAVDAAPPNATKEVYASIFTSSKTQKMRETFTCRSLPLGRN